MSKKPWIWEAWRADYRASHPTQETRLDELEMLVAALLFGGEEA